MRAVGRAVAGRAAQRVLAVCSVGALAGALHAAANARLLRQPPAAPPPVAERVSVLVPARDEAGRVAPCIRAVLAARGVPDLEVVVCDDGSRDGTADVVLAEAAGDPRLRVVTGADPPPGWLGKPHACDRLAREATGGVLVFLDADVVLRPDGIAASVALLRRHGLGVVSPYPRQEADGLGPRLVQPLLQWSWLTTLPLRIAERAPFASMAVANGQLLVCDTAAYRAWGGHAAVRGAVVEDVELARAARRSGVRVALVDGTAVATCRMYEGWADLRDGYTKSLWAAFGSPAGAVAVAVLLAALYVVPPVAALGALAGGRPRAAAIPAAGYAAGVAGRVVAARRTGGRALDGVAHPASVAVFAGLVLRSLRARAAGRLTWRGRPIPGRAPAPGAVRRG